MKILKSKKRGFTLIELLVVIAIIGILSSVVLASMNNARKKARDARRESDLKSIQLALENYYDDNGAYPTSSTEINVNSTTTIGGLVTDGYIGSLSEDPSSTPSTHVYYKYITDADGSAYCLGATVERDSAEGGTCPSSASLSSSTYKVGQQ